MSRYMTSNEINACNKNSEFQMKCEENLENYRAMVQNNYDKLLGTSTTAEATGGFRYRPDQVSGGTDGTDQ